MSENTIPVTKETVALYKSMMAEPKEHGLDFPPLSAVFENSEEVTPRHILYQEYIDLIKKPLPKVFFYIVMDTIYFQKIGKATSGDQGYRLKIRKQNS